MEQNKLSKLITLSDEGNTHASYKLAMYYERKGDESSMKLSFKYYTLAAAGNQGDSIVKVGNFYEEGRTVEMDIQKAIECYGKGIDMNIPSAFTSMALLYQFGLGVEQNNRKAYFLHKKSGTPLSKENIILLETFFLQDIEIKK